MKRSLKDIIVEIKTVYDIAEYMRGAGIQLQPNGTDKWKTCCPFHKEKTPSFIINESHQFYKCFGCGVHGDIISFVETYENLTFMDSITKLAQDKNIEIDLQETENTVDYKSLQKILKHSANFYYKKFTELDPNHEVRKQISDRGLSENKGLVYGYSPAGNALYKSLSKAGFSDDLILQSGVCRKSENNGNIYDFFRRRLMFIITDRYNKPVGFSSRKIYEDDTRGKYVNSTDSPLFHKSKVLYNHYLARKTAGNEKTVYIVEGQFDVAAFIEAGLENVVASSGTSFTAGHIQECRKLVGNDGKFVFCFDGDTSGVKAAQNIFLNYPDEHSDSYVVMFPEGKDPCDYRLEEGNEALIELVSSPVTLVEFMLKTAKENYDLTSIVEKSNYVDHGARIIKCVTNPTIRENCIKYLSLVSMSSVSEIREAVNNAKPLELNTDTNEQDTPDKSTTERIMANEKDLPEEVIKPDYTKMVEGLKQYVEADEYYDYSVRCINLGLMRPAWRKSLLNVHQKEKLFPKFFNQFFEDLEKLSEREHIFPELFENNELADYLMQDDFSSFYKFMSFNELKHHYIYLHDCLVSLKNERHNEKIYNRAEELLRSEGGSDVEYMKDLLQKVDATIIPTQGSVKE